MVRPAGVWASIAPPAGWYHSRPEGHFRPLATQAPATPGMHILPVRRMRVPEEIVDQIRGFIASGELKPGDQLPSERELTERFQVSRASIREALTALQVMGILERSRTGGG